MKKFCLPILLVASSLNAGSFCTPCETSEPLKPKCAEKKICDKKEGEKKKDCCFDLCGLNFYAGLAVGTGALAGQIKVVDETTHQKAVSTLGGNSLLVGKIFGVSGCFCDCWYFAAEGNVLFDSYNQKVVANYLNPSLALQGVKLQNQLEYGADARLGISICNCKASAFVLLGFEAGQWEMKLINNTTTSHFGVPAESVVKVKKTLLGPKIGLGTAVEFCKCFIAELTYSFINFGDMKVILTDSTTGDPWKHKATIQQNQALLSASFKF